MIIVNTLHQSFENENSCGELVVSTPSYNNNNFTHFLVHKPHKNFFIKSKTSGTSYDKE